MQLQNRKYKKAKENLWLGETRRAVPCTRIGGAANATLKVPLSVAKEIL